MRRLGISPEASVETVKHLRDFSEVFSFRVCDFAGWSHAKRQIAAFRCVIGRLEPKSKKGF